MRAGKRGLEVKRQRFRGNSSLKQQHAAGQKHNLKWTGMPHWRSAIARWRKKVKEKHHICRNKRHIFNNSNKEAMYLLSQRVWSFNLFLLQSHLWHYRRASSLELFLFIERCTISFKLIHRFSLFMLKIFKFEYVKNNHSISSHKVMQLCHKHCNRLWVNVW